MLISCIAQGAFVFQNNHVYLKRNAIKLTMFTWYLSDWNRFMFGRKLLSFPYGLHHILTHRKGKLLRKVRTMFWSYKSSKVLLLLCHFSLSKGSTRTPTKEQENMQAFDNQIGHKVYHRQYSKWGSFYSQVQQRIFLITAVLFRFFD